MIRAAIRVDASTRLGLGHVTRCLVLAQSLRQRGASVEFVSRAGDGDACAFIEQQGFTVARLTRHSSAQWEDDAEQTRLALTGRPGKRQWLVVDHYGLDRRWERAMRASVDRILAIDDLANRVHDCDALLDQNLVEGMAARYQGKVPDKCTMLLGPQYALLQAAYAEMRAQVAQRQGTVKRVLISFGGADLQNITNLVLRALLELNRPDIHVDVVVGAQSPHGRAIATTAAGHANVKIRQQLPSLASLLARADLAIGGCGSTTWERLCLGVPSLVITIADNQRPSADCLHRRGLIRWLGDQHEVQFATIQEELREALAGADAVRSKACRETVDGLGADRVADVMLRCCDAMQKAQAVRS